MRLYDTMSREDKGIVLKTDQPFRFYCCGPTVYGPAHIGNFRTFVMQDVLRRTLEVGGRSTYHIRNITDVDDKTIRDSQKANQSLKAFTQFWTKQFHEDTKKLALLPPHVEPSAVEHIPQQIRMIESLIEKQHAYISDEGSVYFKITSYNEYGGLSRLDQRELMIGKTQQTRSNSDEYGKDHLADFVLWKARKAEDGECFWQSPWGEGRPGWHLECSAMIQEYLGNEFDLHSGGVDLIFPHHENEIAQSICGCGGHFARHWFHVTHLLVDGAKMSKSLGNLYTLQDLENQGFSPVEVRYVLISTHYRKALNFTLESLSAAREALLKLAKAKQKLKHLAAESPREEGSFGVFQIAWDALQQDLNVPAALGCLFTGIKEINHLNAKDACTALYGFEQMLMALGLVLPDIEEEQIEAPLEVQRIAAMRWQARLAKDWASADLLRHEIESLGWQMKDHKDYFSLHMM